MINPDAKTPDIILSQALAVARLRNPPRPPSAHSVEAVKRHLDNAIDALERIVRPHEETL